MIALEKVLNSVQNEVYIVKVPEEEAAARARRGIKRRRRLRGPGVG